MEMILEIYTPLYQSYGLPDTAAKCAAEGSTKSRRTVCDVFIQKKRLILSHALRIDVGPFTRR